MKNLDPFSKKLLSISLAFAIVLLSASAFLFSINKAFASDESSPNFMPQSITASGKYMMSYQMSSYQDGSTAYNVLVWDTETGKSRIYFYSKSDKMMKHWEAGDLPAAPLD